MIRGTVGVTRTAGEVGVCPNMDVEDGRFQEQRIVPPLSTIVRCWRSVKKVPHVAGWLPNPIGDNNVATSSTHNNYTLQCRLCPT